MAMAMTHTWTENVACQCNATLLSPAMRHSTKLACHTAVICLSSVLQHILPAFIVMCKDATCCSAVSALSPDWVLCNKKHVICYMSELSTWIALQHLLFSTVLALHVARLLGRKLKRHVTCSQSPCVDGKLKLIHHTIPRNHCAWCLAFVRGQSSCLGSMLYDFRHDSSVERLHCTAGHI